MSNEQLNRFQKNDAARAKRLRASAENVEQREAKCQQQRDAWRNHARPAPTIGGTKPDAKVLEAKKAFEDYKLAEAVRESANGTNLDVADIQAIADGFEREYYKQFNLASQFNCLQVSRAMQWQVHQGKAEWKIADFVRVAQQLQQRGYLEPADKDFHCGQPACPEVPRFVEPQKPTSVVQRPRTVITREQHEQLANMDFEELQRQARSGLKAYNPRLREGR